MQTPRTIGRYEIVKEIGRGAMGLVYLAHDPRIDRPVAIKTLKTNDALPAQEAEDTRLRFVREAQAAGKLQHPGIVTIFDVGEHEGIYFIAMEYIEGETLDIYTKTANLLPPDRIAALIAQACDALDYAHGNRVIHRDIKPANLMLLSNGRLKITDFGLAKNPTASLTMEGILIGTPNYMSPEQVTGKPLDGRTDLFSLGAVFYELLTGARPFHGESVTTIIYRILNETPRIDEALAARVPAGLARVVGQALEKDPARRFQSGREFAAALSHAAAQSGADAPARRITAETIVRPKPPQASQSAQSAKPKKPEAPAPLPASASAIRSVGRIASATLFSVALVLLLPASASLDDRWGRGGEGGLPPFHQTAAIVAGQVVGPDMRRIAVTTFPAGGKVYLDDKEAPGGVLSLPGDDRGQHVLVAEDACFIERQDFRAGTEDSVVVRLKTPKVGKLAIASTPPGAIVVVDGRDTGKTAPAQIPVSLCDSHTVALSLRGYKDARATVKGTESQVNLTLAPLPEGWLKITAGYPVEIYQDDRKIGDAETKVKLTEGRHRFTLRNPDLFLEREVTLDLAADKTLTTGAGLPSLGAMTILTSPGNCTLFINGRDVGAPPITGQSLVAASYTVRAVYNPTGDAQEQSVVVEDGATARVNFKFTPK